MSVARSFDRWTLFAFIITGAIGPALILLMPLFPYPSSPNSLIYSIASTICPTWIFGPMESSWGSVVTWTFICVTNVAMWAFIGAIFSIRMRLVSRVALLVAVLMPVSYFTYWTTASLLYTLLLSALLGTLALYRQPWTIGRAA